MNLATFEALLSRTGQATLADATGLHPSDETFLSCYTRLQKRFEPELAKAALETVILRKKARAKFAHAEHMYFTREALEQASGEVISRYRAQRFAEFAVIGDLCCGLGGDTIAFAENREVIAVEIDELRLAMAKENLKAYGLRERVAFHHADVMQFALPRLDAIFFDPARRTQGYRRHSVAQYQPRLEQVKKWLKHAPALAVKISPGVDLRELAGYDCEVEFISVEGELKECVLWFGACKRNGPRATLLPSGQTLTPEEPASRLLQPRAYLYEPDPAVLRAGLVTTLAARIDAYQIDKDIAYLTSDHLTTTPFARAFAIHEAFPFQLKKLRERLRTLGVGRIIVKKRGSPLEPEALIRQLRLVGSEHCLVFLTHVNGAPYVLLGKEVSVGNNAGGDEAHNIL